jgi:hypothetical protein|nr:hypothetical protein [Neorhizobium tomejilense]
MTILRDRLWLALAREMVEEIRPRVGSLKHEGDATKAVVHFFGDRADGSLIQLIVRPAWPSHAEINIYEGDNRGPAAGIDVRADALIVRLSGTEHRMAITPDAVDTVLFVREVARKALVDAGCPNTTA